MLADDQNGRRWPPQDRSVLWRLSSEYAELFATRPVDRDAPSLGEKPNWGKGAFLWLLIAGGLTLSLALLLVWAGTMRLSGADLAGVRVVETLLLGAALLIGIAIGQKYASARSAFYSRVRWIKACEVERALDALNDDLALEKLFTLNRKQLDEYQEMSVRQASTAFRNATITSFIAFAVLIAGAILALRQGTPSEQYVAGGLAGLGATLTTFVSRNFFSTWKETREQLREYYMEPARTSKLLGLERLARDPEAQPMIPPEVRRMMIDCLLAEFTTDAKAQREFRQQGRRRRFISGQGEKIPEDASSRS